VCPERGPIAWAALVFETILVPLDGTPLAELALPAAARLARAMGGRCVLIRAAVGEQREPAEGYLRAIQANLRHQGVWATTVAAVGDPVTEILAEGRRRGADLIVMATHARSGVDRWLAGSVAEGLLQRTPVPLLLVRDAATGGHDPLEATAPCVLVPLDGSTFSEVALPIAGELAARLGGQLVLVQAISTWDELVASNAAISREVSELTDARQNADRYLASIRLRLVDEWGVAAPTTLVVEGQPARAIAAVARTERAALVVMATHGHGGLVRDLPGSNAASTLRETSVPLLLVRPVIPVVRTPV
jgi:nucleotide-binding universal stress UspA family protein